MQQVLISTVIICLLHLTMQLGNLNSDKILSPRTVKTKYGALRGVLISLTDQKPTTGDTSNPYPNPPINLSSVEAFLGVPYATPPVSSLRFMPPVTPSHWRGTRLANKLSPVCPQKLPSAFRNNYEAKVTKNEARMDYVSRLLPFLESQSEDCLYLNVYLPFIKDVGKKAKLPVMVFVHGESYNWGTGNAYDGTILASYSEVVVITLNYRLGPFGFLPTTVDGATRGNYGLMDVMAALHWIHDNINEVGGDANNVTLVGHNRGASFVNLLMISPMGRGLFSKAILMSGSALSSWSISREAENYAKYLSKAVNCPNYDNIVMVECLRSKPMEEILKVDLETEDSFRSAFGPIIDGLVVPSEPRILMESENDSSHHLSYMYPNIRQASGLSKTDSPHHLMFGVTRVEAPFLFSPEEEKHGIDFERRDEVLRTLVRNVARYYQEVISLTLINEYTDWSVPSEHPINILDSLIDILGDALVVAPVTYAANMHFKQQQQRYQVGEKRGETGTNKNNEGPNVFSYVFVHQSEAKGYSARLGCVHGDELPFIFGAPLAHYYLGKTLGFFPKNYTKPEVTLSETVMFQWTNFAKFGSPNGSGQSKKERFESIFWPTFDVVQRKYLMIGLKPKIRDHYHSHRLSFWLNLIPKLEKHGKEESDNLKRHLQDQGTLEDGHLPAFERISLKFLSSLQSPAGTKLSEVLQERLTTPPSRSPVSGKGEGEESHGETTEASFNITKTSESTLIKVHQGNQYTTALSITIAVGLLFLFINLLIFVAVYYHLNKHKNRKKFQAVGYLDVSQSVPQTIGGGQVSVDSGHSSHQHKKYGQHYCESHHHLCGYTTAETEFTNCAVSENGKAAVYQCSNCCAAPTQTICDNNHCLSVIREYDEHL